MRDDYHLFYVPNIFFPQIEFTKDYKPRLNGGGERQSCRKMPIELTKDTGGGSNEDWIRKPGFFSGESGFRSDYLEIAEIPYIG